ncbi:MAG: hypothetical protein WAN50_02930, partial [Minisyncoccia bacterium]
IERCPHDSVNPYAQINRNLIRDKSISPNCRWLIIFLLSNKDDWKINTAYVAEHVKEFIGRDCVLKLFNEAIKAGYMERQEILNGNLKNGYRYFLSESPKFKKCFRQPEIQGPGPQAPGPQAPENQGHKKEYSNNKHIKNNSLTAEAVRLSEFLLSEIKKRKPDFSGKFNDWSKIFNDLLKLRTRKQIETILNYMLNDEFWFSKLFSPKSIKNNLDQIEYRMKLKNVKPKDLSKINKEWALKVELRINNLNLFDVGAQQLCIKNSKGVAEFYELKNEDFMKLVIKKLKDLKIPIEIEDLVYNDSEGVSFNDLD